MALASIGAENEAVVVLDADIADSCKTESFRAEFPERSFDLGVAEQSLPTFAAGLALSGFIPICNSFAVFVAERGLDLIRQSVAYNRANVKLVGHSAGQSMGYTGPSHHTLEDVSALRAIPGMTILSPSDARQVGQMMERMVTHDGPVYLRLARANALDIHDERYEFKIGETVLLREGSDVAIYFTGDLAEIAFSVADRLSADGHSARIVEVPTVKPLDPSEIVRHAEVSAGAITLEDHNILGGLGSAISEIYATFVCRPVRRVGIRDTFTESDTGDKLRDAYGLSVQAALDAACSVLEMAASIGWRNAETGSGPMTKPPFTEGGAR